MTEAVPYSKDSRNYHLDLLKLLASMAVVLIHVMDYTTGSKLLRPVLELAVPIFFMVTGYFVGHRSTIYIKKYVKKLISLYVSIGAVYWVGEFIVYNIVLGYTLPISTYFETYIVPRISWDMLLAGEIGKYHLWYIWAIIIGILLFMGLKKCKLPDWLLVVLAGVGYIISLNNPVNYILSGGFPKSLFFITVGHFLHNKTQVYTNPKRWLILPALLVLVITLPFIRITLPVFHIYEIMVALTSSCLFYFAVTTYLPKNKLAVWGTSVMDETYLYHLLMLQFIVNTTGFGIVEGWYRTSEWGTVILFILTYLSTLLFIQVVHYIKKQWARYLTKE